MSLRRAAAGLRRASAALGWTRRREPSIRARLVVLVLSVVVPAALVLALASVQVWQTGREATERALVARAQGVASAIGREVDLARATLQVLATSPFLAAADMEGFAGQLANLRLPPGGRVVLSAPDGRTLVNSRLPYGTPLPLFGRPQDLVRVFSEGETSVSDFFRGPATRDPLVSVSVPVRDTAGRVAYALTVMLQAEVMNRILSDLRLPRHWAAAVLDRQGILIGRSRAADRFVGGPATAPALDAIRDGINPFRGIAQEGEPALGSHAPVEGTGWTVVVVVSREELEAPLRNSVLLAAFGSVTLLLVGLGTAALCAERIGRSLVALAEGAAALGRGAAPPPVPRGVREASWAGTALRRAARSLARRGEERDLAERRRALVVAELNHRVKNMLATVQAVAAQTQRGTEGDPARFGEAFGARLRALARAHDLLTLHAWDATALGDVVHAALAPWLSPEGGAPGCCAGDPPRQAPITVRCACGVPLDLRPIQAQSLVLALHELATNAVKYGALSTPGGRVEVSCGPGPDGTAALDWVEIGGPPIAAPPARRGFGTRLLERGLARDLGTGATVALDFAPAGLRAAIRAPLLPPGPPAPPPT